MTEYSISDADNVVRLRGTISPAPGGGAAVVPGSTVTGTPTQDGYVVNQVDPGGTLAALGWNTDAHASLILRSNLVAFSDGTVDPATTNADLYGAGNFGLATDGGLGMFSTFPPAVKPAAPVTLGDVIALLQSYGMSA